MRTTKHIIPYTTGNSIETERTWLLAFNYIPGRPGTYFDPPEGEEFEFLTATLTGDNGGRVVDFDDWIDECGLLLDDVVQYASDALMEEDAEDEDERENGPSNDDHLSWSGPTDVQRHVPGVRVLTHG